MFSKQQDFFHQFTHPNQLFMWSEAALAADMAELSFLAAITAAPRLIFIQFGKNNKCERKFQKNSKWHLLNSGDKDILDPGLIKTSRCT